MQSIRDFIPKDKFDNSHIEDMKVLSDDEIMPILLQLLEWIQDMNWPVAREILPVLAMHQEGIVPLILNILSLQETDDMWKYFIINSLLPLMTEKNLITILPSVQRIAFKPTKSEHDEEVDRISKDFLKSQYKL